MEKPINNPNTEYIEKAKAVEVVKSYGKGAIADGKKSLDPVDDIILLASAFDFIPAADVEEVKHGEWIKKEHEIEAEFKCSLCGYSYIEADPSVECDFKRCPECGAKMDGKEAHHG